MTWRDHQAFLIARLVPHGSKTGQAYYRCIGVHNHLHCYGALPLTAVHRFITLLKNPNNADIVRDEIRRVQSVYGRMGEEPRVPLMPCPYVLLLLSMAWNMDLEPMTAYASGSRFEIGVLDPDMGSFDYDNDDGITIIDVTDPSDPGYCFVFESDGPGIPLDAKGYISISQYHDIASLLEDARNEIEVDLSTQVTESVANLDDVRLLTSGELAEVWPDEYLASTEDNSSDSNVTGSGAALAANFHRDWQSQTIPSLVNLTLPAAVEYALVINDTEQLEEMVWMPGKADLMKKTLIIKNPLPDGGLSLVVKILAQELQSTSRFILDLSMFPFLSSDQVGFLIETLSSTSPNVKSLNLSGNHNISIQTVTKVLNSLPYLVRLVLLDTSIADNQLLELMLTSPKLFYNLYDLVHPAFLRAVGPDQMVEETLHPAYRHGFTFVVIDAGIESCASMPIFHPEKLLQTLVRHISILKESDRYFNSLYIKSVGPISAMSTGASMGSQPGTDTGQDVPIILVDKGPGKDGWNSRSVVCVPRTESMECFFGVGWMFLLKAKRFHSAVNPLAYGFVKVDRDALEERVKEKKLRPEDLSGSENTHKRYDLLLSGLYKIYDVKGFLKEMEREGRPIPSEKSDIIAAFEHPEVTLVSDRDMKLISIRSLGYAYKKVLNDIFL
ncbi:hypothetical protein VKT23_016967 [Stygiomarasmius scandens]|uniref:Uncharacterized protein n=1 Tax=Marasmiellus scandens TaxID=2682957 RepID=A0ABR1IWC9_9AGAR